MTAKIDVKEHPRCWAWLFAADDEHDEQIGYWAYPYKATLLDDGLTDNARPITVRLVPEMEYRRMRKALEDEDGH